MNFLKTFSWLLPMLAFTGSLLAVRMMYTHSHTFLFIIWNLFLAGLPLLFSSLLGRVDHSATRWLLLGLWLLFFPNAMYIVTDLFHLKERTDIPQWYDLLILFSAAITGVIMGLASLQDVEVFLAARLNARRVSAVVFLLFLLCGYGIYLGRYLRWNSWDIFTSPIMVLGDIARDIIHPRRYRQSWMVTGLFATWLWIFYRYFKNIGVTKIPHQDMI